MGKVKKRNVIIIIIILIALSIVFFFVKSNSYQKRIEKILDSAFQENSYNKINDKKYITEKDWKKIKYGFVGEKKEKNIEYKIQCGLINFLKGEGKTGVYIEYYVYEDSEHKKEKEGGSGDIEIKYKIKNGEIFITEIEEFI